MGVVYKARDTHLDRFVAIKVLPADKVTDPERRRRFVQEAKAASALQHPNIITVHDIAQADGLDVIVMEHVEGTTLGGAIPRAGMRLGDALRVGVQIARALEAAHAQGIVHRDIKPENVMVTPGGTAKVLDFGVAKLYEIGVPSPGTETRTAEARTGEGMILGTAAYMSPEQAEGKLADARSDIFSFGAVLYEMVTGRRAFTGDSTIATLSAVLHQEPKPLDGLPHDLEKCIRRCLRKDPGKRFQHMDELCVALEELKAESDSGTLRPAAPSPARARPRRRLAWAVAALFVLLVVAGAAWRWAVPRAQPGSMRLVPLTTFPGNEVQPAFSPDGKQVAFSWNGPTEDNYDIYVMLVGTDTSVRLTTDAAADGSPVWSPDGRRIAFVRSGAKMSVMLMSALGGSERELADTAQMRWSPGIDWSPDGRYIAFPAVSAPSARSQIVLLSPDTGERRVVSSSPSDTVGDGAPRFSPDGKVLAFVRQRSLGASGIGIVSLADPSDDARIISPATAQVGSFAWTPDSREVVFTGSYQGPGQGMWRMPANGQTPPVAVLGVGQDPTRVAIAPQGAYLAYEASAGDANLWRLDLEQGRPAAAPVKVVASTRTDTAPDYSPDGRRIVFASTRSGGFEIWVCGADGSNPIQVTRLGAPVSGSPRWSPDGRTIAFDSDGEGQTEIYAVNADGGPPRRLTNDSGFDAVPTWSRDSHWIYFTSDRTGTRQLWKMPAEGGAPVQITKHGGVSATESADGKTLYYAKDIDVPGMWRVPVGGGEEVPVLDAPERGRWGQAALAKNGIYYVGPNGDVKPPQYAIFFHEFATRRTTRVALLARPPGAYVRGLALSPDERALLYVQWDGSGSDLMLLENFR
jgi:Tol biopolymer transport system component